MDNNFIKKSDKKRKAEFILRETYLREYDQFPRIKRMVWDKTNIPSLIISETFSSSRPIFLTVQRVNDSYHPFGTELAKSSFTYYRGKISKISEKGQLVYNGRGMN